MSEEKISQVKNVLLVHNNDSYLRTLIKFTHSKTKSLLKPKAVFWDKERGSSDNDASTLNLFFYLGTCSPLG